MAEDPVPIVQARAALGGRLAALRSAAGHTQEAFAKLTFYGRSSIANIETGRQAAPRHFWTLCDEILHTGGTLTEQHDQLAAARREHQRLSLATRRNGEQANDQPTEARPGAHDAQVLNEEAFIMATADESADLGFLAARSNINDDQLDVLNRTVDEIAISLLTGPLMPLFLHSRHIRDQAFDALRGRQYPRQSRQLYAIAARVCGLLSVVAADRLRLYDAAMRHANAASIAADLAEDPALRAWTASMRSSIAFWQANYHTAADIASAARAAAPTGVESARLASLEARAWAKIGNHKAMSAALAAAFTARDDTGPSAGPGLIAFPLANQLRLAGAAYLWIGDYPRACNLLAQAVTALRTDYDSMWHIAAARVDLADARVRLGQLDDATEALEPLLSVPREDCYLGGAARRVSQLVERIERSAYADSAPASELSTRLRAFAARQNSNREALAATATAEVPRPR